MVVDGNGAEESRVGQDVTVSMQVQSVCRGARTRGEWWREPWAREWAPAWVCALHRKGRRRQYTTLHNTTICNDITHFHCLYTIVSQPTSLGSDHKHDPVILKPTVVQVTFILPCSLGTLRQMSGLAQISCSRQTIIMLHESVEQGSSSTQCMVVA